MDRPADIADLETVRRCLAGQREAFAEIVARHQRVVYGVALRMLGDRDQADDAAQETFVRAYSRLSSFRGDSSLRAWLIQIATRMCIDLLRARRRRPEVALDDADAPASPAGDDGVTTRHSLARAIADLPPHYKAAIILRHLQHMSYADMARTLGIPLPTVKTHLRRARQTLRARMEDEAAPAEEISP
ncbi:MAG TPA: sigma-70 family RNA polymerase sigma factor [Armatimonadota bacterium]|nr:sigma-70 family RNA polymerase sigma factor [Armatimonadota bacterium]